MQNGEQPIRLPNGLLYPRVEVEQRTHSGDEIGCFRFQETSESLLPPNLREVSWPSLISHRCKCYWSFYFVSRYFH